LVRFSKPKSLLELVRIDRIFSEVLGRKTDLLTKASISPYLRDRIKNEMEVIYEKTGSLVHDQKRYSDTKSRTETNFKGYREGG